VIPFTTDDAAALDGPDWLRRERVAAMKRVLEGGLPTSAEEIWRYSRIDELDLGRFRQGGARPEGPELGLLSPAAVVRTEDGRLASVDIAEGGFTAGPLIDEGLAGQLTAKPWDAFAELNRALAPDPLVIRVPTGAVVDGPIVVVHGVGGAGVAFPRTIIDVGPGARVSVVEHFVSSDVECFVAPVVELLVHDDAEVGHVVVQELGPRVWQTAYLASRLGRDASLRAFTVALGGDYARVRTDSVLVGAGGRSELAALYFGTGTQMHDFRTLQDHEGPKSTSDLVFKGAVAGEARSAYSGLIRVHRGAAGTKAFQTNRNLVLSDTGLATYSVPNLDIEENDVSCSHASATGPIDPDQRFYLESRGVPPEIADRLIVLGFFADVIDRLPTPGLRAHVADVISAKLRVGG
jgi:Fe-S cluster assembly protein SufD